jgi:hypothetical protein
MFDSKGKLIRLGDWVNIDGDIGVVVFSIDPDEFSVEFPKDGWSYLGSGIMVKAERYGLVWLGLHENHGDIEIISKKISN